MYLTGNSMDNLFSYCGLVDARISASEKDLPEDCCTPSPWLTRICLTRISLTRIFKKFPFLT